MSQAPQPAAATSHPWRLNTSNAAKLADYRALMVRHGLALAGHTQRDLPEIDADPLSVLVHKASQFSEDWLLVDDGSFEVEGADIGVNIRWQTGLLAALAGRRAHMRVMVGFRERGWVAVAEGLIVGRVVAPRGAAPAGFPVLPFFQPEGREHTLAEHRDEAVNPRALAIAALARGDFAAVTRPIASWAGPWQADGAR